MPPCADFYLFPFCTVFPYPSNPATSFDRILRASTLEVQTLLPLLLQKLLTNHPLLP